VLIDLTNNGPGGGEDTIVDFQDNVDDLDLTTFNYATANAALADAANTAEGVFFIFPTGDRLLVMAMTEATLANDILV
jgi:hypothetical protein